MPIPLTISPLSTPSPEETSPSSPPDTGVLKATTVDPDTKKLHDEFLSRIAVCKVYRRKLISSWIQNIDYRRGKPFASQSDEDRIAVNLDWSLTKAKHASLFSQVPQIRLDHPPESLTSGPWLGKFEERLNDTFVTAGIQTAMDEAMPDVINAAGISAILVAHEALTEDVEIPITAPGSTPLTPSTNPLIPTPPQTITIPRIVDHRYTTSRISPGDLLWPINFTGSDFDNAPWIGRSGRITWAQAVSRFKLTDEDKDSILGEDRTTLDRLTHDVDKDKINSDEMVGFDEIFYKEFEYNPLAKSFNLIHHLVFIQGKDVPAIDEPWKGQKVDASGGIIGSMKTPLRVLTLTYITDETIPPSDSAVARPQINELNKSRTQFSLQRSRSLPIRGFNVNLVDPSIQQSLMRGTWQHMIPFNGNGANAIFEVQRSAMPPENFKIDAIIKADLNEMWQVGQDQNGPGAQDETKGQANIVQSNFQTRISQERARIAKFIVGVAEVLGGLLALNEPAESFGQGFDSSVCRTLAYSILADSTVLLDSNQRLQKLVQFLNLTAKSGWINVQPILEEMAELSGLDPSTVVQAPQPKPPVEPNISLRLTGVEDMMNPLALAFMIKSGQAPDSSLITQAMALIQAAVTPPPNASPNTPPILPGPDAPNVVSEQIKGTVPGQATPPAIPTPAPPPPAIGEAHKDWGSNPKINKRTEGEGGNQ